MNFSRRIEDRNLAKRLRAEAEAQIHLLLDSSSVIQSDFYSYRYFASEGFLPRLTIFRGFPFRPMYRAGVSGGKVGMISFQDPVFWLFPNSVPGVCSIHEGSRYIINKVIMPVADSATEEGVITTLAKLCPQCGYLHPATDGRGR